MPTVIAVFIMALTGIMILPPDASAADWLTYHYDNARDGANTNEVVLTPANVNTNDFFKLFTYTVDGEVYAQPLYMANVAIAGQGTHDVLFVATENDTVYAFDADSNAGTNGGLLWHTNLGIAATSVLFGTRYYHNVLNPLLGITGTPVIDPVTKTLYVDVLTTPVSDTTNAQHHVHALNIADGTERPFSPVLVAASVPGTGVDSSNGVVTFNANQEDSRPALTLAGGVLYVSFGSFGDTDPFHGWVIGFNATNLVQMTNCVFCTTPNANTNVFGVNAGEAALWMGETDSALMPAAIFILKPETEVSAPTPMAGTMGTLSSSFPLPTGSQWPIILHPWTRPPMRSMTMTSARVAHACCRIRRETQRIRI